MGWSYTREFSNCPLGRIHNLAYSVPVPGPVKPFITAGVGAFKLKSDPDASGVQASESDIQSGIDAGIGNKVGLMGLHGFAEGSFESIYTDQGWNSTLTQDVNTQVISVTFGIFF